MEIVLFSIIALFFFSNFSCWFVDFMCPNDIALGQVVWEIVVFFSVASFHKLYSFKLYVVLKTGHGH